ncbi:MAG: hypothetical protein IKG77_03500, partial [Prevotella sp.]|nr:hypothetical protein [Prevotella sp.]
MNELLPLLNIQTIINLLIRNRIPYLHLLHLSTSFPFFPHPATPLAKKSMRFFHGKASQKNFSREIFLR